jgi:uncharacterized protein YqjF (DUF2071 family)
VQATALQSADISELARERFIAEERRPLMLSDWVNATFIHFEVDPRALQKQIPFELDLHDGKAFVSLVAFSIRRLRPAFGGRLSELLFDPIGNHEFLNVRTYVRCGDRVGIFFMAEWLNNRLSVVLGPRSYGLPYQFGALDYYHQDAGALSGNVSAKSGRLEYSAKGLSSEFTHSVKGSVDEFLLERYVAFTWAKGVGRFFQIWHEPWPMVPVDVELKTDSLLRSTGDWFKTARLVRGNYSPGVQGIWMSAPHRTPLSY